MEKKLEALYSEMGLIAESMAIIASKVAALEVYLEKAGILDQKQYSKEIDAAMAKMIQKFNEQMQKAKEQDIYINVPKSKEIN